MAWWQRITYGTTAWRISMGRRQVVESVNAALKGVFTDLGRGFLRVMGVTKMTVLLGFTLAALPRPHPQLPRQARPRRARPTDRQAQADPCKAAHRHMGRRDRAHDQPARLTHTAPTRKARQAGAASARLHADSNLRRNGNDAQ